MEVAIGAMSKNSEQLVMLFDASKSVSQIYNNLKNKKISALSENKHAGKAAAASCKLRDQARNFIGEQAGSLIMSEQCLECPWDVNVISSGLEGHYREFELINNIFS